MKKKILAMVLAVTLVLGCASAFAGDGQNRYNFLETTGSTKVNLVCNSYWQWTVPEEVTINFTSRNGSCAFGDVTIDNLVYSGEKDLYVSVSVSSVSALKLTDVYKYTDDKLYNETEIKKKTNDYAQYLVDDSIPAVTNPESNANGGWGLIMDKNAFADGSKADDVNYELDDGEYGFADPAALTSGYVQIAGSREVLAIRTDIATGKIYKLDSIVYKSQATNVYNKQQKNDLVLTAGLQNSIVEGSIQGISGTVAKTTLKAYCWGSPKYIGTYKGTVSYTMKSQSDLEPLTKIKGIA